MQVYQNDTQITTWIYFYLKGTGSEFLDYKLPFPNVLQHINRGYYIGWQINGYPGTKEAREYFNDIIARFLITFKDYYPEKLDFKPKLDKYTHIDLKSSYELKQFQNLKSIPIKKYVQKRAENINTIDQTFWAIKYYTEDLIREMGFVPYELLEEFAFRHFYHKEKSTLRSKCKAIWNWYNERDWTIPQTRSFKMTRSERAKKNAELKKQRAKAILFGFIQQNLFSNEYKRDGKWNITKLSKATKLDPKTIRKYIKEIEIKQ
jgi:hypothetical protein